MSVSLVTALTESLVWSVENTRCPVSDAFMEMSAVSLSLISPTSITSGSCLSTERRPFAKVRSTLAFTCIWFIPCIWYSTGSSMVMIFLSGRLIL